jgi:hypothetical protein
MTSSTTTLDIVGGAAIIGGRVTEGMDMVRLVRRGLPVGAMEFILDTDPPPRTRGQNRWYAPFRVRSPLVAAARGPAAR